MTTTDDLDAFIPDDLPEWRSSRLVAEQRRIHDELAEARRTVIRLERASRALRAERERRTTAFAAALPRTIDTKRPVGESWDDFYARLSREMRERFPVGSTLRIGKGEVLWTVTGHADDYIALVGGGNQWGNARRMTVGLGDLHRLTRIDPLPEETA